ncbi:hypothetical protein A2Z33_01530 [Candidatus Gottesmanbacteria bacterium RBG_16_52_11]|uniref:Peptidase M50 domain-containing protein n=1 Tax=Candidatus Gottesmanbacteria bacterium RBG_16_52_11 TaxID=1798374 RepID=A0A1F5YPC0_9BACT|nr:MAG: hypothetical protein A2Z33_01530 [Candidatus Gottesmanbacteria bacterium RBG_16_52_11]
MLLTVIVFFIILSILVFVHELGHFTVARLLGVKVEEFGFGLPPRIAGWQVRGTVYSLNWLPIGGFVKLAGEDEDEDTAGSRIRQFKPREYFFARSKKERSLILIAGVSMNFLVAVILTAVLLLTGVREPAGRVHIERVLPGTPAEAAGLTSGDIIRGIKAGGGADGLVNFETTASLISTVKERAGQTVELSVERSGSLLSVSLTPRVNPPPDEGAMGVAISDTEERRYTLAEAPLAAVRINIERAAQMLTSLGTTLYRLVTLKPLEADVAGPIGIAQVTGEAVRFGWKAVIEFMGILSLNLAVLNILPVPALDGGRLAFIFAEKILGRKVKPAFEKQTHQIGMLILLLLILLVSINDIMRITRGG